MVFGNKKIFKKLGEIHVGNNAPEGFLEINLELLKKTLVEIGDNKFWRCHVCNDLHLGLQPLEICPTCMQKDAYIEINEKEFRGLLQI